MIHQLIQKLGNEHKDVRQRSIHSLLQKIKAKIIKAEDLIMQFPTFPKLLLQWINEFQKVEEPDAILKILQILHLVSNTQKGAYYLVKCEAAQFLCEFKDFVKSLSQPEEILGTIDQVLQTIVSARASGLNSQKKQQTL